MIVFQTTLRILPYDELTTNKDDIDHDSYQIHQVTPHVRVTKTFNSYLKLREKMEEFMVFDKDNAPSGSDKVRI